MKRKSDAEIMGEAEKQIGLLIEGKSFDTRCLASCEAKFATISKNGSTLKNHFPKLIKALDDALVKFYPHPGPWDDGHRSELLNRYIAIIGRITDGHPVEIDEMNKVLTLLNVTKTCFENFEKNRNRS